MIDAGWESGERDYPFWIKQQLLDSDSYWGEIGLNTAAGYWSAAVYLYENEDSEIVASCSGFDSREEAMTWVLEWKPEPMYRNFYRCSFDATEWQDEWTAICNDPCPLCGKETEPYETGDI